MTTVISTLVTKLGFSYSPDGIKRHDADLKKSTQALGDAERKGRSFGSTMASAGKTAAIGIAAVGTAAIAAGAVVARFTASVVTDFAQVGNEIAKSSQALGVTTDELQRMRFAATASGASSEALAVAVKTLNRQMLDASKTGKGPLVDALDEIGVEITSLGSMTTERRMMVLGEALRRIEDPSKRSALAMKIFGEQGTALIPMLNEGASGLARLYRTAEDQPTFLRPEQLENAESLTRSLGKLQGEVKGAGYQIGAALAPKVEELASQLGAWIAENEKLIKQDLPAMMEAIADVVVYVGEGVGDAVSEFAQLRREAALWDEWSRTTSEGQTVRSGIGMFRRYGTTAGLIGEGGRLISGAMDGPRTNVRGGFEGETEQQRLDRFSSMSPAAIARVMMTGSEADKETAAKAMTHAVDRTRKAQQDLNQLASAGQSLARQADMMISGIADQAFGSFAVRDQAKTNAGKRGVGAGRSAAAANAGEVGPSIDELINSLGEDGVSMRDALDAARSGMPTGRQAPLAGAQIVRIDASYNATTNVSIELPPGVVQEGVGAVIDEAEKRLTARLQERDRQAFAHYESAVAI